MMGKCLEWMEQRKGWAPVPLRLLLAFVFIPAGWGKITGLSGVAGFLEGMGFPLAIVFATLLAVIELAGGIAVLLGWYTRHAATLLAITMAVAIVVAHLGGGYEKAAVALVASLSLMFSGAGDLSVDNKK